MARPKKIKVDEPVNSEVDATEPSVGVIVTFTGDPRGGEDPEAPVYGGKIFPKGRAVEVDAAWLTANANVRKNNHFRVE